MIAKLTKKERKLLRDARKEWQIIISRSRKIGFEYVLQREAPNPICFGSTIKRDCLPTQGPAKSSIMQRLVSKAQPVPAPGDYHKPTTLIKQFPSKYGYTDIANRSPRCPPENRALPGVGAYNIVNISPVKESPKPFGVGDKYKPDQPYIIPGPGTYNFRKRKIKVSEAFGTSRRIIPAVTVFCGPENSSMCEICDKVPDGDYYHQVDTKRDMCRACMFNQIELARYKSKTKVLKFKRLAELENYIRARYCGFYHDHGNTMAAIKLLPRKELVKKLRAENYLATFNL